MPQPARRRREVPIGLPWRQIPVADEQRDRGHGRIETRQLKITTVDAGIGFPHARLAIQIVRRRRPINSTTWSSETVYAITSLSWRQPAPTDQDAECTTRGLPYGSHPATCPVRAWRRWLGASGIIEGPAFRSVDRHGNLGAKRLSDRAVADMVKRRALAVDLDGAFGGHSLRAGFATEGYAQGTPELAIMRHGRWRSASVMRGYIEEGSIWNDNAASRLGL